MTFLNEKNLMIAYKKARKSRKEKLILNPKKVSFNKVGDGIKFVGYKILNQKIYVGKNAREKTNRFINTLGNLNQEVFGKNDIKRINNSFQSGLGVFSHCSFGLNYFKTKGKYRFPLLSECE